MACILRLHIVNMDASNKSKSNFQYLSLLFPANSSGISLGGASASDVTYLPICPTPASPSGSPSTLSCMETVESVRSSFRAVTSPPVVDAARDRAGTTYVSLGKSIP